MDKYCPNCGHDPTIEKRYIERKDQTVIQCDDCKMSLEVVNGDHRNPLHVPMKDDPPTIKNVSGETVPHPEYTFITCKNPFCDNDGSTPTTALDVAHEKGRVVYCTRCECEHDEWKPGTIEIVSTHDEGAEIEAECQCGKTLYTEILAEEVPLL